jgi:hypothetical protein
MVSATTKTGTAMRRCWWNGSSVSEAGMSAAARPNRRYRANVAWDRVAAHQPAIRVQVAEELCHERAGDLGEWTAEIAGLVEPGQRRVRRGEIEQGEREKQHPVHDPRREHGPPAVACGIHDEPQRQERAEQPAERVGVGEQGQDRREHHERPARGTGRSLVQPEQEAGDQRRHEAHLHGEARRLERPRQQQGHGAGEQPDLDPARHPVSEDPEEGHGQDAGDRRDDASGEDARSGHREDRRQQVDVRGGLPVSERLEEQRPRAPVLVDARHVQRPGVPRER